MSTISSSQPCFNMNPGNITDGCIVLKNVQDLREGDAVLTMNLDGNVGITHVTYNKRHLGDADHIRVAVKTVKHERELVVTENHLMLVHTEFATEPRVVAARDLAVGDLVRVHGSEALGVVQSLHSIVLDHKNELVTADGTVSASGIQVTTMCGDYVDEGGAAATLASWQISHSALGLLSDYVI